MISRPVPKLRSHFRQKKLRRNFYLLAGSAFFADLRVYSPVAVLAFQSITGSFTLAMSVFAVMSMAQAVFEIPTGVLSDKFGRRLTLVVGATAELLAIACYALAFSAPHGFGLWVLYAGSVLYGFSLALFSGNNQALLYETLSYYKRPHEIPKLLGRVSSMGQFGLAASGILAGICLWAGLSYRDLILLSLISGGISTVLCLFIVEPPRQSHEEGCAGQHMLKALSLIIRHPSLRWLAFASAMKTGISQTSYSFTPGFVESVWPLWLTPVYRLAQNGLGSVSFWFAGSITKRFGALKALFACSIFINTLALVAYTTASIFSPLLLIITELAYGVTRTSDSALQQETFSDAQRATMGSLISFAGALIASLSSVMIGWLADGLGPSTSLIILLLFNVPISLIYFGLYRKHGESGCPHVA